MAIYVRPVTYTLWWLVIVGVHGIAAVFHVRLGSFYSTLPDATVFSASLVDWGIVDVSIITNSRVLSAIHYSFFAIHALSDLRILQTVIVYASTALLSDSTRRKLVMLTEAFGERLILAEIATQAVVMAIHTRLAYRMSHFATPLASLRNVYAAGLALNCWATAVVVWTSHWPAFQPMHSLRLLLLVNGAVVVSFVMFFKYNDQYDMLRSGNPMEWLNDAWAATIWGDLQLALSVSGFDCFCQVLLSSFLLLELLIIRATIVKRVRVARLVVSSVEASRKSRASSQALMRTLPPVLEKSACSDLTVEIGSINYKTAERLRRLAAIGFVAWGATILGLHSRSELLGASSDVGSHCPQLFSPWGRSANRGMCPWVDVDCYALRISGQRHELASIWQNQIDASSVQLLVLRHCPHLEIPPSFPRFSALKTLRVFNCTIDSWQSEAAASSVTMQALHTIQLVRVNFSDRAFPDGLLSPLIPDSIKFVALIQTNLVTLPDTVATTWAHLFPHLAFSLDYGDTTQVPDVFAKITPRFLSLSHNSISHVPRQIFESNSLTMLNLAHTAISALPANVTHFSSSLAALSVLGTKVGTIPAWFDPFLIDKPIINGIPGQKSPLKAGGTPFCASLAANLKIPRVASYAAKTDCGTMDMLSFPLALVSTQYAITSDTVADSETTGGATTGESI